MFGVLSNPVPDIVTVEPTKPFVGEKDVIVGGGTGSVKELALVAVPPAVVTAIVPVEAPVGTVAVILVALTTEYVVAAIPLNLTAVAPVKFVPVMVTVAPIVELLGVNELIVGAGITVKLDPLVAVPPGVVTEIIPVVDPVGTVAVILVELTTVKVVAAVPLKLTAVVPVKFVPVMVIVVPIPPLVGVKDEIVGAGTTVKLEELVTLPPGVVIAIVPVVAPVGTVAVILVALFTVKLVAFVPLKDTAEAHEKLVPVIVTVEPIDPLVGVNEEIAGAVGGLYTKESPILALELLRVLIMYSEFDNALMFIVRAFGKPPSLEP